VFYELEHISSADYFKKVYCKNFSFPPHIHNCFELVVSLSGKTSVTVDNQQYDVERGEAVFIFPHQLHSFAYSEGRNMICIFSPKIVSAYYEQKSKCKPQNNKFKLNEGLIGLLNDYECNSQSLFEKGVLYLICNEFDKFTTYDEDLNKNLLEKIFLFINKNFKGECSLTDVAANIGYNASYVSRYFKKCVGISLTDYITMVRLGNVCHLYENSNDTIINCALNCGFDSVRTFNRNFKKLYNASPSEYFRLKK